jgi:hypothetical protein
MIMIGSKPVLRMTNEEAKTIESFISALSGIMSRSNNLDVNGLVIDVINFKTEDNKYCGKYFDIEINDDDNNI